MTEPLTPNERDELASAYLDGELNRDGIALVEGDPDFLNLVADHRDVQSKVASPSAEPSAAVRAKHLASALAAYDELGLSDHIVDLTDSVDADDNTVISLSERSAVRVSRRTRSGMPTWLSAAAASVAVLGGLTYATTQLNGGSDDSATDAAGASAEFESEASATTAADSDEDTSQTFLLDSSAAMSGEDAASDDAMEENSVAPASEPELAENDDYGEADESSPRSGVHEPEIDFPAGFPANEIVMIVGNAGFPIDESVCAFAFEPPPELAKSDPSPEPDRFLPVFVGDQEAELFIYGPETGVLVDVLTCQVIPEAPQE